MSYCLWRRKRRNFVFGQISNYRCVRETVPLYERGWMVFFRMNLFTTYYIVVSTYVDSADSWIERLSVTWECGLPVIILPDVICKRIARSKTIMELGWAEIFRVGWSLILRLSAASKRRRVRIYEIPAFRKFELDHFYCSEECSITSIMYGNFLPRRKSNFNLLGLVWAAKRSVKVNFAERNNKFLALTFFSLHLVIRVLSFLSVFSVENDTG